MNPPRRFGAALLLSGLLAACAGVARAQAPAVPAVSARAPWLRVDARSLTPRQLDATRRLLDHAANTLPPMLRTTSGHVPSLEWRDDLPEQVHGRTRGDRILLRRALLETWMAAPAHGQAAVAAERAALAALVHELAHLHDRSPQGRLSRDPRLLDLAGWQQRPLRFGMRNRHNPFTDRSPDRYELTSPAEFVAVNLEHFVLDPEYACRRPALFRHFAAHFQWSPAAATCAPDQVFMLADPDFAQAGLEEIDPARVYAVDYLFAEGNQQAMSRWGHSMLRLVVCAPGRAPGPECRLDLVHHRVLSFRAFVGDVQISGWRGLTGSYPLRLFALPLDQVIDEYTRTELRGLQSIPLRLDRGEIATLLERAAQLHWTYDGRYYFVSNNCAVETWRLLHDGVPRLAQLPLRSITPTGLLRKLEAAGIADASVLEDRSEAMRQGYYFEALDTRYQAMYEVARTALDLPYPQVLDWLDLAPAERAPWLQQASHGSDPAQAMRAGAALLLLEEAALRRQELLARDAIKRRLLEGRGQPQVAAARDRLEQAMAQQAVLTRPALLSSGGYGLPQAERAQLEARAITLAREAGSDWRGLRQSAREALPMQTRESLAGIEANLKVLGSRLRALNQERGGLQLNRGDSQPPAVIPAKTGIQ